MKLSLFTGSKKQHGQNGAGLLLAVLFFAGVFIAAYLATYLTICRNEYTFVARSQNWNASMVMAEAGVEDALAFINQNANGAVGTLGDWPSSASSNGWTIVSNSAPTTYTISRSSMDSAMGSYTVYVTNSVIPGIGPTILSIGTANWKDAATTYINAGNNVRKVLVETAGYSQGSEGIIAYAGMNFNGNNVTMDSFDSADPNHSEWQSTMLYHGMPYGIYSDSLSYDSNSLPSRTSDVMVATDGAIINVGNANIYGFVDTAPNGQVNINNNGSVGDLKWVSSSTSGIEPGHGRDDMNQIFYSKSLPSPTTNGWQTGWLPLPNPANGAFFKIGGTWTNVVGIGWTNVGGTQYQYSSSGVSLPSPDGSGSETYTVIITNMPASTNWVFYSTASLTQNIFVDAPYSVLWTSNGIKFKGKSYFTINTNADITIYTTGNVDDGGQAIFDNGANYAKAFSIYDVNGFTNLNLSFTGNGVGSGYIYTPSSSVTFGGGGNQSYGFVGCLFCNNISINGHYTFHFDEVFNQTSKSDEYLPTMWQEVQ